MAYSDQFEPQFTTLFQNLEVNNTLVLTPNKRLSRLIRDQFNLYQTTYSPKKAWPSLQCLALQTWWHELWQQQLLGGNESIQKLVLTGTQELLLWQQVVNSHEKTPVLLSHNATARLAMQAWRLTQEWMLDISEEQDSDILKAWFEDFKFRCEQQQLVSSVEIPQILANHLVSEDLPTNLVLYGFDDQTPQLKQWLAQLDRQGVNSQFFDLSRTDSQIQRFELANQEQEILSAALWAKDQIIQDEQARVTIVVPQLAQMREQVERIFNQVFEPQVLLPNNPRHATGFNMSAGQLLSQLPMIDMALGILRCNLSWLDMSLVAKLLNSPFVGMLEELNERSLLEVQLRSYDYQISLQKLKITVGEQHEEQRRCPDLYQRLADFQLLQKQTNKPKLPSEWLALFSEQLLTLGWPGQRHLDTLEYQQLQAWQEALNSFAALDAVVDQGITFTDAFAYLQTVLAQVSFQAQTRTSPIQILGVLEAAGLPFDRLWFMNLDDETWPPSANPNPLLPIDLQVRNYLPQSSAERELAYASQLTKRLINSAKQVVFSHSRLQDDKVMAPSPLIEQIATSEFTLSAEPSAAYQQFKSQDIEASLDSVGPRVIDVDEIKGGSQLLKDQAACPFRAFARHRLHAQDITDSEIGLQAHERGNLVHLVMEIIWRNLKNQERLLTLSESELESLIVSAIDDALISIKTKRFVGERFLQIEAERLKQQVRAWLELEKQREPFTVIFNEGRRTVRLGKLPIGIRYDRVDKLEDGKLLVLDYKTGKQHIRSWTGTRPDEPQVPLYAVANEKRVTGAAYGQITAEEIAFKGIAEEADQVPGLTEPDMLFKLDLPDSWPEILQHWREILMNLAKEFMAGSAAVDPKVPGVTCRYCELKALCRIKEQFDLTDDGEDHSAEAIEGLNND